MLVKMVKFSISDSATPAPAALAAVEKKTIALFFTDVNFSHRALPERAPTSDTDVTTVGRRVVISLFTHRFFR